MRTENGTQFILARCLKSRGVFTNKMKTQNGTSTTFPPSPNHLQYVLCGSVRQHISFLQVLIAERHSQQALPHTGKEVQGDGDVGPQDYAQQLKVDSGM